MPTFQITAPDGRTFEVNAPAGTPTEDIIAYAQSNIPAQENGLVDRISEDLSARGDDFRAISNAYQSGQQGLFRSALQGYSPVLGAIGDVGGELVNSLTPDLVKEAGRGALSLIGQLPSISGRTLSEDLSEEVPRVAAAYQGFEEQNPQLARDISGVGSVLGALTAAVPANRAIQAGASLAPEAIATTRGAAQLAQEAASNIPVPNAVRNLVAPTEESALAKIYSKLEKEIPDTAERLKFLEDVANNNDVTLAESGGQQIQRLARGTAQFPSGSEISRDAVGNRIAGSADRIKGNLGRFLSPTTDLNAEIGDIVKAGRAKAAPLYDVAFSNRGISDPVIDEFLTHPEVKAGIGRGLQIQRLEAQADGVKFDPNDYAITDFNEAGDAVIGKVPNMRLLDSAKRGLDAMINDEINPITGDITEKGRALTKFRNTYVERLRSVNPAYKDATNTAGDYLKIQQASRDGVKFQTADRQAIEKQFSKLSTNEKDAYKAGMVSSLRNTIDRTADGANLYSKVLGNQNIRGKLQAVMSPTEYENLTKSMAAEDKLFKFRNSLGNSITAEKLVDASEFLPAGTEIIKNAAQNGIRSTAFDTIFNFVGKQFTGLSDKSAQNVAKILYETDPAKKLAQLEKFKALAAKTEEGKEALKAYYSVNDAIEGIK